MSTSSVTPNTDTTNDLARIVHSGKEKGRDRAGQGAGALLRRGRRGPAGAREAPHLIRRHCELGGRNHPPAPPTGHLPAAIASWEGTRRGGFCRGRQASWSRRWSRFCCRRRLCLRWRRLGALGCHREPGRVGQRRRSRLLWCRRRLDRNDRRDWCRAWSRRTRQSVRRCSERTRLVRH
jgi:hypothetical protein